MLSWCIWFFWYRMSEKILVNNYVPEVVPSNLKWFERDGLLTYIDQLKYERFISDPDKYLEKANVIKFEMIHNKCRGDPRTFSNKHYQTVVNSDGKKCPRKKEKRLLVLVYTRKEKIFLLKKNLHYLIF